MGGEEPLPLRRRALPLERRQESHTHDHGPRLARRRLPRRAGAEREPMITTKDQRGRTFFVLSAMLIVAAIGFYLYQEPQTAPARAIFHSCYSLTGGSDRFLTFYSHQLREANGGYIPTEVDTFLCSRLRSSESASEFD